MAGLTLPLVAGTLCAILPFLMLVTNPTKDVATHLTLFVFHAIAIYENTTLCTTKHFSFPFYWFFVWVYLGGTSLAILLINSAMYSTALSGVQVFFLKL